jgi:deoxyribose-phosphate aldolase
MEYANHLNEYAAAPSQEEVVRAVSAAQDAVKENYTAEVYKFLLSSIDLTSLSCEDSEQRVSAMARRAAEFSIDYPALPSVASICVYPPFVETVGLAVDGTPLKITAVAGGFPSSQTFLEVKMLEVAMAIENGADEVDVVLSVGKMLTGAFDEAANEIEVLRAEAEDATLKVILETGALGAADLIYKAALLSMAAGADFIKTSTGKIEVSATPEAVVVMCEAIKAYYALSSRRVGIKIAGGVRTAEQAALYYTIVEQILGEEWLTPDLFRIGASSAANNILSAIEGKEVKYF